MKTTEPVNDPFSLLQQQQDPLLMNDSIPRIAYGSNDTDNIENEPDPDQNSGEFLSSIHQSLDPRFIREDERNDIIVLAGNDETGVNQQVDEECEEGDVGIDATGVSIETWEAASCCDDGQDFEMITGPERERDQISYAEKIELVRRLYREGHVKQLNAVLGAGNIDLQVLMKIAWDVGDFDVIQCIAPNRKALKEVLTWMLDKFTHNCTMDYLGEEKSGFIPDVDETRRARELELVSRLLELGVDANEYVAGCECTPLDNVICNNRIDLARCLVRAGADVNAPTRKHDDTYWALECACDNAGLSMVKFLVRKCGAIVNHIAADGSTPLSRAADSGDWKLANWLVGKAHADPNLSLVATGRSASIPILAAAACNFQAKTVSLLIEVGKANVNVCNGEGDTPLIVAATPQYYDPYPAIQLIIVKILVQAGGHVNAQNKHGTTPLHQACKQKLSRGPRLDLVKYLVKKAGADVSIKDRDGMTPLMVALSCYKHFKVVQFLHDQNPDLTMSMDINARNGKILFEAVRRSNIKMVAFLLENTNIDVHVRDEDGRLPVHYAKNVEIVRLLLRSGTNVNDTDRLEGRSGRSLLHNACSHHDNHYTHMIGKLVHEFGANVDLQDAHGNTPLHKAAKYGSTSFIRCLILGGGANPTLTDNDGRTPLHVAATGGHTPVLRCLLRQYVSRKYNDSGVPIHYCVDVNARDDKGRTALSLSCSEGHQSAAQLLIRQGGASAFIPDAKGRLPLHYASKSGDIDIVQFIVRECSVEVNIKDEKSETAVWKACRAGKLDVLEWLVENARGDLGLCDKHGNYPIHIACRQGHHNIVKWILDRNPQCINLRNNNGESPLHHASFSGDADVSRCVLSSGDATLIHATDEMGQQALHILFYGKATLQLTRLLVDVHLANVKAVDKEGNTPLHLAILRLRRFQQEEKTESDSEDSFSEILSVLLDRSPPVTLPNMQGENALFLACADRGVDTQNLYKMVQISVLEGLF